MVERLAGEPHIRLRFFCSPHHQDSALYPVIAHLERAAGFRRDDTAEERLGKLEALVAQGANEVSTAVPLLADLLSLPAGERYPPLNLTPQKRKEKTLAVLTAQVEGLSGREPVLTVYEDVHWSDPTTRESLDLLVDRLSGRRVLAIITFRPEFTPPWVGRPHVTLLTLNRLPPPQRAEMIGYVTGGKALPKEIAEQIVERTDGVPLFIEELTKSVVESGLVSESGDRYAVAGPVSSLAIPTSLHASLLARLDRLAPTREVAQIGAALGRSFSHEVISAVGGMPQTRIDDALEQLVHAELIFRRGTPPDAEYTFKHALVQDAAYSTLLRSRRQQIHARVASVLEQQFPETVEAQPQVLARHCTEAGFTKKAIAYLLKATQQSMGRSAMPEAEAQIRRGLELVSAFPEDTEAKSLELDLQMLLGPVLFATVGYTAPSVAAAHDRAGQLCRELDRPYDLAVLLSAQCVFHVLSGDLKLAVQESDAVLKLAQEKQNPDLEFCGYSVSTIARFHIGDFIVANRDAERADPGAPCILVFPTLIFLFRSQTYLGYLDRARAYRDEALTLARQRMHGHTLVTAESISFEIDDAMQIEPNVLRNRADEVLAHADQSGFPYWSAVASQQVGISLMREGQAENALKHLLEALAKFKITGGAASSALIRAAAAEALCSMGQRTEAFRSLDEALHQIELTNIKFWESEVHRVYGECLIACDDLASAEGRFNQALAVARQQNAKLWEIRAATSLAQLLRNQGKRLEAHNLLASIYGWFSEGFDTPVLRNARALLHEIS
jgi:tetratricopeptide (TPR) repeat protein